MARPKKPEKQAPSSIRIPPALMAEIKEVAKKMERTDADVIRLATEIGLEHLRRIKYDLRTTAYEASVRATEKL